MYEVIGSIVGVFVAIATFKLFFTGRDEFYECIRFWFTPDFVSMFKGEYWADQIAEFKLGIWLLVSVTSGVVTFIALKDYF